MTRGLAVDVPRVCSDDYRPDDMYRQSGLDTPIILKRFFQGQRLYLIGFSRPAYFHAMNELTLPIALVMVGSSLFIMLFLPLFFYSNLNKPMNALLDGFQQVNQGRLDVSVPVLTNDEIGWLAQSFNAMAAELRASVAGLENQITLARQAERALREQQEQLRAFSARLGEVEEAERKKLGRELHDQAGQNLTALSLTLKLIRTQLPASAQNPATLEQLAARLDDASELVRQTTQRIRNVMEDLQPPALEEFGLPAALSWYATHFSERTGVVVEVSAPEAGPRPAPQVEIALFRIAQEALTNIARHAHATRAEVHIAFTPTGTRMCIRDNGLGFDDRQPHDTHRMHWGLRIMAERAISIGGVCRVESAPSQGTKVLVEVQS
jgi:signal transduction histidine kinase